MCQTGRVAANRIFHGRKGIKWETNAKYLGNVLQPDRGSAEHIKWLTSARCNCHYISRKFKETNQRTAINIFSIKIVAIITYCFYVTAPRSLPAS